METLEHGAESGGGIGIAGEEHHEASSTGPSEFGAGEVGAASLEQGVDGGVGGVRIENLVEAPVTVKELAEFRPGTLFHGVAHLDGEALDVVGDRPGDVDDAFVIARANGQLVHVDVGRIEQAAFLGDCQHRERVGRRVGGQGRSFEGIERDRDLRPLVLRRADLFAGYLITKDRGDGRSLAAPATADPVSSLLLPFQTFPLTFQSPSARLSIRIAQNIRWYTSWQFFNYHERFQLWTASQDYRAHTGYMSLQWSF